MVTASTQTLTNLERGFLGPVDPLTKLPGAFAAWEQAASDLPKLLVSGRLRHLLDQLHPLDTTGLTTAREVERAMLLLSYLGHGYVWGGRQPERAVPPAIAIPWVQVAKRAGRPPVLSYASYALDNWRRMDPFGPVALGNIVLLQNFLGGLDEEWFVLVHVQIEAEAAPALQAIGQAQAAAEAGDSGALNAALDTMAAALVQMNQTLDRMPEGCDPHIYYHRVRPYIHGWKNNPALPNGLVYSGVAAWEGRPQQFRGETGAQSAIVPSLDAALGITHADDPLRPYVLEMQDYMPPAQRAFIQGITEGPSIREAVLANRSIGLLRDAYNRCLEQLAAFRSTHLEYAGRYIHAQSRSALSNPTEIGTGGTPFMPYLRKHRDETLEQRVA
jgi:indoleamine 2,3-dioxygenase